jgi:hypothetical protein
MPDACGRKKAEQVARLEASLTAVMNGQKRARDAAREGVAASDNADNESDGNEDGGAHVLPPNRISPLPISTNNPIP